MSLRKTVAAVLTTFSFSACYKHIDVKPEQLPRLNGGAATVLGQSHNTTIVGVTVGRIEGPDGRLHEIHGGYNLLVSDGKVERRFDHPVESEVSDSVLRVRGANRGETRYQLAEVDYARVEVGDPLATTLLITGVTAAVLAVTLIIIFSNTEPYAIE